MAYVSYLSYLYAKQYLYSLLSTIDLYVRQIYVTIDWSTESIGIDRYIFAKKI
jgi:hypothetical protein